MNRNKKVGYTYYGKGGARHTGITNNPKRRLPEHNKATGGDGFRRNLSAAGPPILRNQTRCNHPFYRPAENRMCPDRAGAAPRGTIFVKGIIYGKYRSQSGRADFAK